MVIARRIQFRFGLVALAVSTALLQPMVARTQDAPEAGSGRIEREAVITQKYMAVAANPLASAAGSEILRAGGSAVDAAIAIQLVLGLVEPQSSGLGGGAFLVYYDAKAKQLRTYDGRETAPAAAKPDRFLDAEGKPLQFYDAVVGGKSVGVPGAVRMLELAHKKHGRLPWKQLFQPAIKLAEQGFAISPRLYTLLNREQYLQRTSPARNYFFQADGTPKPVGTILVNRPYAQVLRQIAKGGADAFYKGEIAKDIVATVQQAGVPGDLTTSDLAAYQAIERPPVCAVYRVYKVCGMGAPSGGLTVLQILGILENFNLPSLEPASLQAVHLFSEAGRLAYADRGFYIADPDFVSVPSNELLDPEYLKRRARLISLDRALTDAQPGELSLQPASMRGKDDSPEFPSTSHLSVVDRYGNAVSMTSSIEDAFGSRLLVRGFLLNNELTDFSFSPTTTDGKLVANRIEPGKRPRSAMAPMMVFDQNGKLVMVVGSVGGARIINYVAKTLVAALDWKLDSQQAVALPNFGNRNSPTDLEAGTANVADLKSALEALGHSVQVVEQTSGSHAIIITEQGLIGGADPRREGQAIGK
ncbi:gamma-glutamyltransferase [Scytonema tolypothrichoides VB-61278]|nr:gamma-glutamyltransferase [Scytonema tolypothrichoides VB-61278]